MSKPRVLILASGTAEDGGSGFENLVLRAREGVLNADIVVASNHQNGGVRGRARRLEIPFYHFSAPWSPGRYQALVEETRAEFVALSGWLKQVVGLDWSTVFNIHPGPLPDFGGKGMFGKHVHEAVLEAYKSEDLHDTEVCMHFVTPVYDQGPVFFRQHVPIREGDTVESLQRRVNEVEHRFQPEITNLVVNHEIRWDGKDPESLQVPSGYEIVRH